ncbi:ataxin-2-like protein [Limulus polyphemus]|uniref:Ataxin-2-like protein n=1 Tax=Limulus polyphemus TaxID=6850 RepID=A0ABM1S702_LIMPO|nr:ataxin-2-like protein [Limulus polyphemus]
MNSNTKKKNRANTISKPVRPKGSQEKYVTIEGVYNNARFMHGAASLVGCIVQVQVKDGNLIEGVFKTFSPKMELVLEMPHTVDSTVVTVSTVHGLDPKLSSYINNYSTQDSVTEKLIFSLEDVVMVKAVNIDLDYATRGFTDSSISKFNGQILEKELEPWEEPPEGFDRTISLEPNKEDAKNGWDANEMFRTNAEKYGVTSTYDSTLQGYTVPLERKNTEEYKKQEAKAMKIALEIENSQQYRTRIALENGDEEEKYSAVIRPTENMHNNSNRYVPPQKRRNVPGSKVVRTITQPPSLHPSKLSQHVGPHAYSYGHNRPIATTTPSPLVTTVTTPSPNHASTKPSQTPVIPFQQQTISPHQPHHTVHYQEAKETRVNGGKMPQSKELRTTLPTENKENIPNVAHVTSNTTVTSQPVTSTSKPCEKRKDQERKGGNQKGRDEQLAEFKKFSSDFRVRFLLIYSVFGPRMVPSQAVGMVPSSHAVSYGEYSQMGGHIYMSPHMGAAMGHSPHGVPMSALQNMIPQASSGPHSAPSTPQSQTPGTPLHAPSPVHQQPPGGHHITPAQTPTPTGHPGPTHTPQPVVYSQMLPQPSIQHGHHNHNTSQAPHINQSHPHPHHSSFSGTPHPQSMIFMPPTPHHSVAPPVPHTLHGHPIHGHNPGSHAGTPTHVIPHMPITVIPTSATMGPTPTPMVSAPFIGHPQGRQIHFIKLA